MNTTTRRPRSASVPATDKQIHWILTLADERVVNSDIAKAAVANVMDGEFVSKAAASEALDYLFAAAKVATEKASTTTTLEAGMYRKADGTLVRVYLGKQSGRMLAKKVVGSPESGYDFEYMGLASSFVTTDEKMSLEEAKEWGQITGTCCMCAARLDDPNSVAAGIGPVCAEKF